MTAALLYSTVPSRSVMPATMVSPWRRGRLRPRPVVGPSGTSSASPNASSRVSKT